MRLTFPNMGNMYIPVKVLLDELGISYVLPRATSKKTIELGVQNSPESICLPFKTMLGEFIDAISRGADCVLFGGGCGLCRLGYYGELYKEVAKWQDIKADFIFLNTSKMSLKDIWKTFKPHIKGNKYLKTIKAVFLTIIIVFSADKLIKISDLIRCREVKKGTTDKILKDFHGEIIGAKGFFEVFKIINKSSRNLKNIEVQKDFEPLKILVTGEIYMSLERHANLNIIEKLGRLGAEVKNNLSIGYWVKKHFLHSLIPFKLEDKEHKAALEYFKTDDMGGHGLLTVGSIINAAKSGYDGVVHIYPLGCMPEIAAFSSFSHITDKYGIPILSLVLDEMTGEAGLNTRLEAFIDMLESKKALKSYKYFEGEMPSIRLKALKKFE